MECFKSWINQKFEITSNSQRVDKLKMCNDAQSLDKLER